MGLQQWLSMALEQKRAEREEKEQRRRVKLAQAQQGEETLLRLMQMMSLERQREEQRTFEERRIRLAEQSAQLDEAHRQFQRRIAEEDQQMQKQAFQLTQEIQRLTIENKKTEAEEAKLRLLSTIPQQIMNLRLLGLAPEEIANRLQGRGFDVTTAQVNSTLYNASRELLSNIIEKEVANYQGLNSITEDYAKTRAQALTKLYNLHAGASNMLAQQLKSAYDAKAMQNRQEEERIRGRISFSQREQLRYAMSRQAKPQEEVDWQATAKLIFNPSFAVTKAVNTTSMDYAKMYNQMKLDTLQYINKFADKKNIVPADMKQLAVLYNVAKATNDLAKLPQYRRVAGSLIPMIRRDLVEYSKLLVDVFLNNAQALGLDKYPKPEQYEQRRQIMEAYLRNIAPDLPDLPVGTSDAMMRFVDPIVIEYDIRRWGFHEGFKRAKAQESAKKQKQKQLESLLDAQRLGMETGFKPVGQTRQSPQP